MLTFSTTGMLQATGCSKRSYSTYYAFIIFTEHLEHIFGYQNNKGLIVGNVWGCKLDLLPPHTHMWSRFMQRQRWQADLNGERTWGRVGGQTMPPDVSKLTQDSLPLGDQGTYQPSPQPQVLGGGAAGQQQLSLSNQRRLSVTQWRAVNQAAPRRELVPPHKQRQTYICK